MFKFDTSIDELSDQGSQVEKLFQKVRDKISEYDASTLSAAAHGHALSHNDFKVERSQLQSLIASGKDKQIYDLMSQSLNKLPNRSQSELNSTRKKNQSQILVQKFSDFNESKYPSWVYPRIEDKTLTRLLNTQVEHKNNLI